MTPPSDRITLGKAGEDFACRELERRGYEILARRFRTRYGEIDIVAREGEALVFVEVKARRSTRFGEPSEAVHWRKQQTIARIAAEYVLRHGIGHGSCRFDVVSVVFGDGLRPRLEVLRGAFDARR
jgi:putative endonuclease